MRRHITALAAAALVALPACTEMTDDETRGAVFGGALTAITLTALNADPEWILLGTAAGAAAGAMIARNSRTGECAYSDGRGGYYRARCR